MKTVHAASHKGEKIIHKQELNLHTVSYSVQPGKRRTSLLSPSLLSIFSGEPEQRRSEGQGPSSGQLDLVFLIAFFVMLFL